MLACRDVPYSATLTHDSRVATGVAAGATRLAQSWRLHQPFRQRVVTRGDKSADVRRVSARFVDTRSLSRSWLACCSSFGRQRKQPSELWRVYKKRNSSSPAAGCIGRPRNSFPTPPKAPPPTHARHSERKFRLGGADWSPSPSSLSASPSHLRQQVSRRDQRPALHGSPHCSAFFFSVTAAINCGALGPQKARSGTRA